MPPSLSGTVLMAEDGAAVRAFPVRTLRRVGLSVHATPNADEAVEVARNHDGRVDLPCTDSVTRLQSRLRR